jgi:acetylornithine deacetylase/succinyl-diaminopimelate desuccinylase-like protein
MNVDDQLLTHRLRAHVTRLAEEIGERNVFNSEALWRAAAYIEAKWGALGYGVDRLEYDVPGIRCANLIATREGTTRRKEILLLGAHYDSVVGSPGANDNASGVAALLEISRMFQAFEPEITVHIVAFVNEEPPFFLDWPAGKHGVCPGGPASGS